MFGNNEVIMVSGNSQLHISSGGIWMYAGGVRIDIKALYDEVFSDHGYATKQWVESNFQRKK